MRERGWVRLVLRLYPRDFRDARAQEIDEFVRMELEGTRVPRSLVALRLAWDLVVGAWRVHRHRSTRRSPGNGGGWGMDIGRDFRLVARGLGRTPGFTFLVVATLALGVGLNTALFSVVNGVLLRPLGFRDAEELVYLQASLRAEDLDDVLVSGGTWRALQGGMPALGALEAVGTIRQNLDGAGLPRQVEVGWVSPGFLSMLGVGPEVGRLFTEDDPPGTAILSHALWIDALGGDPGVLGRAVQLDGHPYTIVGVLPSDFRLELPRRGGGATVPIDVWKNPDRLWQNGDIWDGEGLEFGMLRLVGRLGPGSGLASAQAQADAVIAALLERDSRYEAGGFEMRVHELHARVVEGVRPTLLLLLGAVGFVLLIACANVANLLAVRAHGRRKELAVRVALGSPRIRLARFLLIESLVLALLGCVAGLAIPTAFVGALQALAPAELPRVGDIRVDGTVVAYAVVAALLTTLLVGVAPALHALRTDPSRELGNARGGGARGARLRGSLVVAQVALSLMLLVGAGLLTSSLVRLQAVEPGFEAAGLFAFGVSVPGTEYGWPEEAGRFYRDVEARVADLPGVASAGVVWPLPFAGSWSGDIEAGPEARALGVVPYYLATEAYFPTARIPVKDGRLFRDGDRSDVAVISEEVARDAFHDERAIGRTVRANPWGRGMQDFEVIGVVGDVRARSLREPPTGAVYFDARAWSWVDWEVHVVARTDQAPASLVPVLREAVASLDPSVPVAHPTPVSRMLDAETAPTRFVLLLLGVFAAAAAVLALVGLYGVVSYTVGLQRTEIGIRMALGARASSVERLVVGRGVALALAGAAVGIVGAVLLSGLLESLLFGVRPRDPGALAVTSAGMVLAAVLASWLPARRAARMSPVEALRSE